MAQSDAEYDRKRVGRHIGTAQGPAVPFPVRLSHTQRLGFIKNAGDSSGDQDIPLVSDLDGEEFLPIYVQAWLKDRSAAGGIFAGSIGISNAITNPPDGIFLNDSCIFSDSGGGGISSFLDQLGRCVVSGLDGWDLFYAYPDPDPVGILRLTWTKLNSGRSVNVELVITGMR